MKKEKILSSETTDLLEMLVSMLLQNFIEASAKLKEEIVFLSISDDLIQTLV